MRWLCGQPAGQEPWLKVVSGEIFLSLCLLVNLCLPGSQGTRRAEVEHVEANELTGQQSVLLLSRKRRKQPLSPQLPPLRLFWNSSGPAQWRVVPSALTNAWASCLCCPWLGPSWPPGIRQWGMLGGCLGGQPGSCGFLGPPRVLSSVATSEGPFVHPFIQKSGCNCAGYKAPSGPDFPPLPVAWLGAGFPGSWTAAFCPLLGSWGPISSFSMPNIYSSNPPLPPPRSTPPVWPFTQTTGPLFLWHPSLDTQRAVPRLNIKEAPQNIERGVCCAGGLMGRAGSGTRA